MKIIINYDADYRNGGVYNAVNYTNAALYRIHRKINKGEKLTLKEQAVLVHLGNKYGQEDLIVHLINKVPIDISNKRGWMHIFLDAISNNVPFYSGLSEVLSGNGAEVLLQAYGYLDVPSRGKKNNPEKVQALLYQVWDNFLPGGKHNPEGTCPYLCPCNDGIFIEDMTVVNSEYPVAA